MTAIKPGQTVQGMHLTGKVVTGTVLRVRPSIIDRSIQVVDLDVDGREMHLALEDCAVVRAPAPQEDPMPATQTAAPEPEVKVKKTRAKAPAEQPDVPAAAPEPAPERPEAERTTVPWNRILNSPLNPRKAFDEAGLRELAANIHAKGLKQNLVVRPHPEREGHFEIAAGERRWRAIGLLVQGFESGDGEHRDWLTVPADWPVPVLVEHLTDLELLEVATAENVQRRRMTPLEEADAFAALMDHGGDLDEIAAKFGFHRRTVVRRVQISRNLIPEIRQKFEEGTLTLAQVEVLAAAGPETQKTVWGNIAYNPRKYTPAELRKQLGSWAFLVKHRQFPPSWYTGGIVEADLFDDTEPYFLDPKQAMECQLKHARALAEKDVERGAPFAMVRLASETLKHQHEQGDGVVYFVDQHTGKLGRLENLGPLRSWYRDQPLHVAGDLSATGKAPDAPAPPTTFTQAAATVVPRFPQLGEVHDTWFQDLLTDVAGNNEHLIDALYVLASLRSEYAVMALPGVSQAMTLVEEFDVDADETTPLDLLKHLLSLPQDAVHVLSLAYKCAQIESDLSGFEATTPLLQHVRPFELSETYLQACNTLALEQLWDDAELGDRAGKSDAQLRKGLLKAAPDLAARGFLPRPLRPEETP